MMSEANYGVEIFALNARWEEFPDEVREHALMCSLDLLGALILGSYGRQFAIGERLAQSVGLNGNVPIIGSSNTYNLLGAAIAMGHSCNSFDIDDGHRQIQGHPGTSFIAGVMAAAVSQNVRYADYLSTLVVCYELTIRWALAMQEEYGYLHSTGAYGAFGTALGVGRLLGFDKRQLNNALSIADFHAPMTPVMRSVEHPSMNKDGVPFGALVGTMAVLETINGSTGKIHILEKPEYARHLDNLGKVWHILELYYKPYACCRWAHQPIKAVIDLMKEYSFRYTDVDKVMVYTFRSATRLSKIEPSNTDEAQYNIAWPVASALVYGDVGYQQVRDEALKDERVLDMMKRLSFVVDPVLESQFPEKRLAYVEICLKSGSCCKSRIYEAPGEPEDPDLNLGWIEDKFRRITKPMLKAESREEIIRLVTDSGSEIGMKDWVIKINAALKK
ncbi:MmgE/PrpD family protein [Parabacteroides sp. ZJ-118]|uniref:MmgE/PrpD family protein n=1 Tax=Parabacteroides sp. ZJ-118 TaxID=2709398 RepID=UPI0013EA3650|nr:MmgE/PrpD family protein [Parabacteroides sp. ZJ-118]